MSNVECLLLDSISDGSWLTDDGPRSLTARHKPDAQGAAPKVSFTVLRSQVARPGFGHERALTNGRSLACH